MHSLVAACDQLSEWFDRHRALAGGSIFAGAGIGGLGWPLMLDALLPRIGFRWTLRIFALMTMVLCGATLPFLRPRLPVARQTELAKDEDDREPREIERDPALEKNKRRISIDPRLLWDPKFLAVVSRDW